MRPHPNPINNTLFDDPSTHTHLTHTHTHTSTPSWHAACRAAKRTTELENMKRGAEARARSASSKVRWPSTLTAQASSKASSLFPDIIDARWKTAMSSVSTRPATVPASVMLPPTMSTRSSTNIVRSSPAARTPALCWLDACCTISGFSMSNRVTREMGAIAPDTGENTVPCRRRWRHIWRPRKPSPPVITTFTMPAGWGGRVGGWRNLGPSIARDESMMKTRRIG